MDDDFGATAYDRVYAADRPELFFKSMPGKVVGPGGAVGIRRDAGWNVPEPELALVLNSRGRVVGYTIGNDMSSRDIEGENLLYLPQAKIYNSSCALGPWIVLDADETIARQWSITLTIRREGETAFQGATDVARIRRAFDDLAHYLFRSQQFPFGAVLLTGTVHRAAPRVHAASGRRGNDRYLGHWHPGKPRCCRLTPGLSHWLKSPLTPPEKLDFGPWEQIFYGEFDGRRRKRVLVKIIGE